MFISHQYNALFVTQLVDSFAVGFSNYFFYHIAPLFRFLLKNNLAILEIGLS